jgi:hypothetical protein
VLICLSFSPGPAMQGSTNNYSGGAAVSAVPSMAKNDPTSTSSNVCKVNLSCFSRTFSVYIYIYTHTHTRAHTHTHARARARVTGTNRPWGKHQN